MVRDKQSPEPQKVRLKWSIQNHLGNDREGKRTDMSFHFLHLWRCIRSIVVTGLLV